MGSYVVNNTKWKKQWDSRDKLVTRKLIIFGYKKEPPAVHFRRKKNREEKSWEKKNQRKNENFFFLLRQTVIRVSSLHCYCISLTFKSSSSYPRGVFSWTCLIVVLGVSFFHLFPLSSFKQWPCNVISIIPFLMY